MTDLSHWFMGGYRDSVADDNPELDLELQYSICHPDDCTCETCLEHTSDVLEFADFEPARPLRF